jgi:exodeoxyribonuclease V gamma subunit
LLPANPSDPADARSRDRVFGEIDAFGRAAVDAGLTDELPADVVRAHFAARFADTDVRQPFLAGGVTFCRMVPMRLIPFRVICLVGLNDRDYPRREASPVLNRLAAALDTPGQRRRGDRSVRDDDRFLFLQLVNAADRVFYASYIGHDANDGSAREPSVVVSELLDAAAAYFDDPAEARRRLVLHHPLQPFGRAPDADARRVRFDTAWNDALATTPGAGAMPPFVPSPLPPEPDAAPVVKIDYRALTRFLIDPPATFLRERLHVRLDREEAHLAETEPFVSADALEHFILLARVHDALIADAAVDETALCRRLQAEGELPPGGAGAQRLREILRQARPIANAVHAVRRGELARLPFELALGDVRLAGTIGDIDDAHAIRTRVGKASARNQVRWHLDALVLAALGDPRPVLTFANFEAGDIGPRALAQPSREAAHAALRWLVGLMQDGLAKPMPFRPGAAWAWLEAFAGDAAEADEAAAKQWTNRRGGEGTDAATVLALRGAMPFVDASATLAFRAWAETVFAALRAARVPESAA